MINSNLPCKFGHFWRKVEFLGAQKPLLNGRSAKRDMEFYAQLLCRDGHFGVGGGLHISSWETTVNLIYKNNCSGNFFIIFSFFLTVFFRLLFLKFIDFINSEDCTGNISKFIRKNMNLIEKVSFGPVKWISLASREGKDKFRHT